MNVQKYDVAVLMPLPSDFERTAERYSGLFAELSKHAVSACVANGQASFDADSQTFRDVTTLDNEPLAEHASVRVVRDLTMPKHPEQVALYAAQNGPIVVNHPALNYFIRNMPTGLGPELTNAQTVRAISIGGKVIGSIVKGNEGYGSFVDNAELSVDMRYITDEVHAVLSKLPGEGKNVIGIDMLQGIDADGDQVEVLAGVRRKPLRISKYDLRSDQHLDKPGIIHLANLWDVAEAALLAQQVR